MINYRVDVIKGDNSVITGDVKQTMIVQGATVKHEFNLDEPRNRFVLRNDPKPEPRVRTDGKPCKPCAGYFFRFSRNRFKTGGRWRTIEDIYMLKRMSCHDPECDNPSCQSILDEVNEGHSEWPDSYTLEFRGFEPKDGDIMSATVEPDSYDCETGLCDGWHVVFTREGQLIKE